MSYKVSLACAGALAAAAALSATAFAAEPAPTPPPPPPPFTWTGLYVGGQIGYAWGQDPVFWSGTSNDDETAAGTFGNSPQGVIGGAHVGYNLQYNPWLVLGIEGSVVTGFNTTIVDTTGFFTGAPGTNTTFSNTRAGWTAGGGIEYAITDNWWVRAEYRYSNFGHTTDFPFPGVLPFPDSLVFLQHHLTENQVQAGFSYRFDWTAPQPAVPVVAKY
jgi:outer membrane immunogenic protein